MRKGFTLIELMVVIAVIGILAAIALVSLTGIQKNARDSQRKSNLSDYATAMSRQYQDKQVYLANASTPDRAKDGATATGVFLSGGGIVGAGAYMATTLSDPQYGQSVCSGQACDYYYLGTATDFAFWTILEAPPSGVGAYYYIRDNGNRKNSAAACATAGTYTNCP